MKRFLPAVGMTMPVVIPLPLPLPFLCHWPCHSAAEGKESRAGRADGEEIPPCGWNDNAGSHSVAVAVAIPLPMAMSFRSRRPGIWREEGPTMKRFLLSSE